MLREAGAVVLVASFVLSAATQCGPDWATPPSSGPSPRTPAISEQQRDATFALLRDALLDAADIPPGMTAHPNGVERWLPPSEAFLDSGGWLAAGAAWLDGSEITMISDTRYAFGADAGAAAYVPEIVASMAAEPNAEPVAGVADGVRMFARTYQIYDEPERRHVALVVQVERVLIQLGVSFGIERTDWRDAALALLEKAQSRTREALAAAP